MSEPESTEQGERPADDRRTAIVGWAFAVVFAAHTVLGSIMPRLDKESAIREAARGWHYLGGLTILALGMWLLIRWWKRGYVIAPGTLPSGLRGWHRLLSLVMPVFPLLIVPLGFLNGWGEGRTIHLAGLIALPTLMGHDRSIWQFAGYFHSALSNSLVLISLAALPSAAYAWLRYRKGLFASFPPGIGFLFLAKATVFIYAVNSFSVREKGYIAASIFLSIAIAFWLAGLFFGRSRPEPFAVARPSAASLSIGAVVLACVILFGLYAPYLMFRVTPFSGAVAVSADPGITWHETRVAEIAIPEETGFEQTVGQETYKWCGFCHTMQPGGAHLVGPNLYNIYGQRAGTVPNFPYSEAMVEAGKKGLVWNDETIKQLIAGPDKMIPGTSMMISSGPVTDPKVQQAVVNALKRDTMRLKEAAAE